MTNPFDMKRIQKLAGIITEGTCGEGTCGSEEEESKQLRRLVRIGDRELARKVAQAIQDPESGWHAKEENGDLVIVVNP